MKIDNWNLELKNKIDNWNWKMNLKIEIKNGIQNKI